MTYPRYGSPYTLLRALTAQDIERGRQRAESWLRAGGLLVLGGVLFRLAQLGLELTGTATPAVLEGAGDTGDTLWRFLPTATVLLGLVSTLRAVWLSSFHRLEEQLDVLEQVHALAQTHPAVRHLLDSVVARGMGLTQGEARRALTHGRRLQWPAEEGFFRAQLFNRERP